MTVALCLLGGLLLVTILGVVCNRDYDLPRRSTVHYAWRMWYPHFFDPSKAELARRDARRSPEQVRIDDASDASRWAKLTVLFCGAPLVAVWLWGWEALWAWSLIAVFAWLCHCVSVGLDRAMGGGK